MHIYFDGTIPITVDVDPLPETSSLDFDFNQTINNGAVAGTYDVTLRYKEDEEAEVVSNQLTYSVYDTLSITNVQLSYDGTEYSVIVTLNKVPDGTITFIEYSIDSGFVAKLDLPTVVGDKVYFTPLITAIGEISFTVTVEESLGDAGSGAVSSATNTSTQMVGSYPMYMGWITEAEVVAESLVWEENMALEDLQSILDSTYVIDSAKSVPVGGDYGYESVTAPWVKLQEMGVAILGTEYIYMWAALPTATFTSEFNKCNDGQSGAQTMSTLWYVEDMNFTIGGASVPYKVYIHKNMKEVTNWIFTVVV
jgi:hypothetical protein